MLLPTPTTQPLQPPLANPVPPTSMSLSRPHPTNGTGTFANTASYQYTITTSSGALPLGPPTDALTIQSPPHVPTDPMNGVYYPGMEPEGQPMFDLNDLQNFFEWPNEESGPPPTGVDGMGPLGWNNLSNLQ